MRYNDIKYFQVVNYIPWLSDHCALRYQVFTGSGTVYPTRNSNEAQENFESIFWDVNSCEKFRGGLRKCEDEIATLLNTPNTEAKRIFDTFKSIVTKASDKAKLRKKKTIA